MIEKKICMLIEKPKSGEWGKDDENGNGIPVIRTANFTDKGVIDYSNIITRIISKAQITEKALIKGDIIIEKSGGSGSKPVGRVVFFDGAADTYLKDYSCLFNKHYTMSIRNKSKAWV